MPKARRRVLPPRKRLVRFLKHRKPVSLREGAALLGLSASDLRQRVAEETTLLPGNRIPWPDVMAWLLDAWPTNALLARLGDASHLLPSGLHLRAVTWHLPAYLVTALEYQARGMESTERYVAQELQAVIDEATIAALRHDPDFVEAFFFPFEEADASR